MSEPMGPEEMKAKALLFTVVSWVVVFIAAVLTPLVQLYWYWKWLAVPLGAPALSSYWYAFALGVALQSMLVRGRSTATKTEDKEILTGRVSNAVTTLIASWVSFGVVYAIVGRGP